jgi:cell division septum initiation protein DivIVA
MAQRVKEKAKRPAGRLKERATPPAGTADARVRTLERECERLKRELEAARRRIVALEESRNLVAARIDGVIESLSGVVDRGD